MPAIHLHDLPAAMGSHSVKPAGVDRLGALPVEIKLQIFSNLPAKEIQKARQTSKHLRDVIDLEENQNDLVRPATSQALEAVQKLHSAIFNFDPDKTDLLSLLSQLHRIRGSPETEPDLVLRLFLRCHTAVVWDVYDFCALAALLHFLCELHDYHYGWDGFPPLSQAVDDNRSQRYSSKEGWLAWTSNYHGNPDLEKFGIAHDTRAEYYDRIVDGRELACDKASTQFCQGTVGQSSTPTYDRIEKPVTLFQGYQFRDERLYEILGVSPIPDDVAATPFDPETDTLYYGVKTLWAYGWVMKLLGDLQAGVDRKINAIELAAVRQEVFLW